MALSTVRYRYNAVIYLDNPHKTLLIKTSCSELCNALVTEVLYEISPYIGPRYSGT